jgi:uncharacterized membrane protein YagU involved in acid resistance
MPTIHASRPAGRRTISAQSHQLPMPSGAKRSATRKFLLGTIAGVIATAPMTAFMEGAFHAMSWRNRHSLPPRKVTRNITKSVGLWQRLSNHQRTALTLAAHFSYGGALGGAYALLVPAPRWSAKTGTLFGLLAWAGNYLGMLPMLHLHEPATRHPRERNVLMIAAHLVWGGALGTLLRWVARRPQSKDGS